VQESEEDSREESKGEIEDASVSQLGELSKVASAKDIYLN